jgi:hypothetical protein
MGCIFSKSAATATEISSSPAQANPPGESTGVILQERQEPVIAGNKAGPAPDLSRHRNTSTTTLANTRDEPTRANANKESVSAGNEIERAPDPGQMHPSIIADKSPKRLPNHTPGTALVEPTYLHVNQESVAAGTTPLASQQFQSEPWFNTAKVALESFERTLGPVPVPGLKRAISHVLKIISQFEVSFTFITSTFSSNNN